MLGKMFAALSRRFRSTSSEVPEKEAVLIDWGPVSLRYFEERRTGFAYAPDLSGPSVGLESYRIYGRRTLVPGRFIGTDEKNPPKSIKLIPFANANSAWDSNPALEHELQSLCFTESRFVMPIEQTVTIERRKETFSLRALISPHTPFGNALEFITKTPDRSVGETMAFLLQTLVGILDLHRLGVVHGDLKPANIVFWQFPLPGGKPQPVSAALTDFGSSITGPSPAFRSATPAYAAPEIWNGDPASPPSDIWAWGAIAFFALTGLEPSTKREESEAGIDMTDGAAWKTHLYSRLEQLEAPTAIGHLISQALRIDPDARPTANELLRKLSEVVAVGFESEEPPLMGSIREDRVLVADHALSFVLRDHQWPLLRENVYFSKAPTLEILEAGRFAEAMYRTRSLGGYVRCADTIEKYMAQTIGDIDNSKELEARRERNAPTLSYDRKLLGYLTELQCRSLVNVIEDGPAHRLTCQLSGALDRWLELGLPMSYDDAATFVQGAVFANRTDLLCNFNFDLFSDSRQDYSLIRRAYSAATLAALLIRDDDQIRSKVLLEIDAAIESTDLQAVVSVVASGLQYAVATHNESFFHEIITRVRVAEITEAFHASFSFQCSIHVMGFNKAHHGIIEQLRTSEFQRALGGAGEKYLALRCLSSAGYVEDSKNWRGYHLRTPVLNLPVWGLYRDAISELN